MKTFRTKHLLLALPCLSLLGCLAVPQSPVIPFMGTAFSDTTQPLDITFNQTAIGQRIGRAQTTTIIGLFSYGDSSIQTAARNGNIEVIDHVDSHITNILFGLYLRYETIVSGH